MKLHPFVIVKWIFRLMKTECLLLMLAAFVLVFTFQTRFFTTEEQWKSHEAEMVGGVDPNHWEAYDMNYQTVAECNCVRKRLWPRTRERVKNSSTISPLVTTSTCSDDGARYQRDQNVVSFSLHMPSSVDATELLDSDFVEGILLNLQKVREYYPGYGVRIYTDVNLQPKGNYCKLVCHNPDLFWCDIRKTPMWGDLSPYLDPPLWGLLPLGDPTVDVFLSRSLKSVVGARESAVVTDWLQLPQKMSFHLMRDNKDLHNAQIVTGLWGARNTAIGRESARLLQIQILDKLKAVDGNKMVAQNILKDLILYRRRKDMMAYDSYFCERWKRRGFLVRPFPIQRKGPDSNGVWRDFVGYPRSQRVEVKNFEKCPWECRPEYGKDWEYC